MEQCDGATTESVSAALTLNYFCLMFARRAKSIQQPVHSKPKPTRYNGAEHDEAGVFEATTSP
jgi:hypothetical protein